MGGFRKAKAEQAALKMGIYGPPGKGKTLTSLLFAEGLAKVTKKRIAFVDTERGTDFYAQDVKERTIHPKAFDFDALYSRSISEITIELKRLNPDEHGIIVIDSITHVWEAAIAAWSGKETKIGTLPFHAWGPIKKPYKALLSWLLNSPYHVIFCGRQGNVFEEDDESGEMKKVGTKMKAEGETAYEPHILLRMEARRSEKGGPETIIAFGEKDRTSLLAGKEFPNPNFDTVIKPILSLLGNTQAQMDSADETASKDAEAIAQQDAEREAESERLFKQFSARFDMAASEDDSKAAVESVGKALTTEIKKQMTTNHVAQLREKYLALSGKSKKPAESETAA